MSTCGNIAGKGFYILYQLTVLWMGSWQECHTLSDHSSWWDLCWVASYVSSYTFSKVQKGSSISLYYSWRWFPNFHFGETSNELNFLLAKGPAPCWMLPKGGDQVIVWSLLQGHCCPFTSAIKLYKLIPCYCPHRNDSHTAVRGTSAGNCEPPLKMLMLPLYWSFWPRTASVAHQWNTPCWNVMYYKVMGACCCKVARSIM